MRQWANVLQSWPVRPLENVKCVPWTTLLLCQTCRCGLRVCAKSYRRSLLRLIGTGRITVFVLGSRGMDVISRARKWLRPDVLPLAPMLACAAAVSVDISGYVTTLALSSMSESKRLAGLHSGTE